MSPASPCLRDSADKFHAGFVAGLNEQRYLRAVLQHNPDVASRLYHEATLDTVLGPLGRRFGEFWQPGPALYRGAAKLRRNLASAGTTEAAAMVRCFIMGAWL